MGGIAGQMEAVNHQWMPVPGKCSVRGLLRSWLDDQEWDASPGDIIRLKNAKGDLLSWAIRVGSGEVLSSNIFHTDPVPDIVCPAEYDARILDSGHMLLSVAGHQAGPPMAIDWNYRLIFYPVTVGTVVHLEGGRTYTRKADGWYCEGRLVSPPASAPPVPIATKPPPPTESTLHKYPRPAGPAFGQGGGLVLDTSGLATYLIGSTGMNWRADIKGDFNIEMRGLVTGPEGAHCIRYGDENWWVGTKLDVKSGRVWGKARLFAPKRNVGSYDSASVRRGRLTSETEPEGIILPAEDQGASAQPGDILVRAVTRASGAENLRKGERATVRSWRGRLPATIVAISEMTASPGAADPKGRTFEVTVAIPVQKESPAQPATGFPETVPAIIAPIAPAPVQKESPAQPATGFPETVPAIMAPIPPAGSSRPSASSGNREPQWVVRGTDGAEHRASDVRKWKTISVSLTLWDIRDALHLPKAAVLREGGKARVGVPVRGKVVNRTIEAGLEINNRVVIRGGLNEGDEVVYNVTPAKTEDGGPTTRP